MRHCGICREPLSECPGHDEGVPEAAASASAAVAHDASVNATYATLRQGEVARTVEVSDSVMVDVDHGDCILGVEVLGETDWEGALVSLAMAGRLRVMPEDGAPEDATPASPSLVVEFESQADGITRREVFGPWAVAEDDSHMEDVTAFIKEWKARGGTADTAWLSLVTDPGQWLAEHPAEGK